MKYEDLEFPPFPKDQCRTYVVTKDINMTQLREEIRSEVGDETLELNYCMSGSKVSEDTPMMLFLGTTDVSLQKFKNMVNKHVPDWTWGLNEAETERYFLIKKIKSGDNLNNSEIQKALRIIVGN